MCGAVCWCVAWFFAIARSSLWFKVSKDQNNKACSFLFPGKVESCLNLIVGLFAAPHSDALLLKKKKDAPGPVAASVFGRKAKSVVQVTRVEMASSWRSPPASLVKSISFSCRLLRSIERAMMVGLLLHTNRVFSWSFWVSTCSS